MLIVNKDGAKQELDEGKLWNSIYYPLREGHYPKSEAVQLADEIKENVLEWINSHDDGFVTTQEIRETVTRELEDQDKDIAFLYETHLELN